jgi:hypothetical protein
MVTQVSHHERIGSGNRSGCPPDDANIRQFFRSRIRVVENAVIVAILSSFNRPEGSALANSGLPVSFAQPLGSLQSERRGPFSLPSLFY